MLNGTIRKLVALLIVLSGFAHAQYYHPSNVIISIVANLPTNQRPGTPAVVTDGASAVDCAIGGGTNYVLCAWNGFSWGLLASGGGGLSSYTVSTLPAGPSLGTLAIVTDGQTSLDCIVGGGTTPALCQWNGSAWGAYGTQGLGGTGTTNLCPSATTGALETYVSGALACNQNITANNNTLTVGSAGQGIIDVPIGAGGNPGNPASGYLRLYPTATAYDCITSSGSSCFSNSGTTTNALTANTSGGAAPGSTFNGSAPVTFDYHSVGASIVNPPFDKSATGLSNPTADATFTYPVASVGGLTLTGTAPASSSGAGTGATALLQLTGVTGGATTGSATTAGIGTNYAWSAGGGGSGSGGTNAIGGTGGGFTLTAGSGGASGGTAANSSGGGFTFKLGAAGSGGSGAAGGAGLFAIQTSGGTTEASITAAGLETLGTATVCSTIGTAGGICAAEGTAPTNVAGAAFLYPDATAHEFMAATNGSSSAGIMVRAQPGALNQTTKTASIATATVCAASAGACNVAGQYHISLNVWGSGTACSSVTAGSVVFTLTWTDENGTSHAAIPIAPMYDQKSAGVNATGTFNFNTALGTEGASADFTISSNGAAAIQYATTYTACTTGTGTYNFRMTATRLQ